MSAGLAAIIFAIAAPLFAQPAAKGDAARGKSLFEGKGACLNCHRVNGNGSRLGPDLSDIAAGRTATPDYLERALLDPDADVAVANRFVRVIRKDGVVLAGTLLNEDDFSVQLRDEAGRLRSFMKSDLKESVVLTKGLMPSYKDKLSAQEVADVVAYLGSLKGVGKP